MKRLHVNLTVADLPRAVEFYSNLFGQEASSVKSDYANWMLDDPRVNFAIASRGGELGVNHLGVQVETSQELSEMYMRLEQGKQPVLEEGNTTCCYANSDKSWTNDPDGVRWEVFQTHRRTDHYGVNAPAAVTAAAEGCCGPSVAELAEQETGCYGPSVAELAEQSPATGCGGPA